MKRNVFTGRWANIGRVNKISEKVGGILKQESIPSKLFLDTMVQTRQPRNPSSKPPEKPNLYQISF